MQKICKTTVLLALLFAVIGALTSFEVARAVDDGVPDEFHFPAAADHRSGAAAGADDDAAAAAGAGEDAAAAADDASIARVEHAYADIGTRVYRKNQRLVVLVTCASEAELDISIASSRVNFTQRVACSSETTKVFDQSQAFQFGDIVKISATSAHGLSVVKFEALDAAPVWIGVSTIGSTESDACFNTYGHNDPWVFQNFYSPATDVLIQSEEPRHFEENDWSFTSRLSSDVEFVDIHVVASSRIENGLPSGTIRANYTFEGVPNPCFVGTPDFVLEKSINGADADNENGADVPSVAPAETVYLTFVLTNTGNVDLPIAEIVLTDSQDGVVPTLVAESDTNSGVVKPGQAILYKANVPALNLLTAGTSRYIVDGCDPRATGLTRKAHRDIATARLWGIERSDPAHYCNPERPDFRMDKLINNADADDPNGVDVPQLEPGTTAELSVVVTNTGNTTLVIADIMVVDNQPGVSFALDAASDEGRDGLLYPGQTIIYRADVEVVDTLVSTGSGEIVSGCDPDNTGMRRNAHRDIATTTVRNIERSDPAHYCNPRNPAIEVVGSLHLEVTNVGNTPLGSVSWTTAIVRCPEPADLAPGQTVAADCVIEVVAEATDGYVRVSDVFTTLEGITSSPVPACIVEPLGNDNVDVSRRYFLPFIVVP